MFLNFLYLLLFISLKICDISCEEKSSLTFVIDDTRSMGDDIDQVRQEVDGIMDIVLHEKSSQINEIVLITFNDPDVKLRIKTTSRARLKQSLDAIQVWNYFNYDCPEMALSGIERALRESQPGSYIYVFTDASAKDYMNVNIIKSLCQRTQSQVFFVLTGHCGNLSYKKFMVYYEIAAASSGQVFRIEKTDVNAVFPAVRETVKGQKAVNVWKTLPPSYYFQAVHFTIDDKTEYVLVSTSGRDLDLYVTDDKDHTRTPSQRIMWLPTGKMLKLTEAKPGNYTAWVKGSSSISVAVYDRTDFLFQHGFSELIPKSLGDTSKQPIAGKKHHLSILVTDPDHLVKINTVQILDMTDFEFTQMPLKKISSDLYVTKAFVSPSTMFKIKVVGTVKKTGKTITRKSRTPIEPQIPVVTTQPRMPVVGIKEGSKIGVAYDSSTVLTCKVEAYPEPKILWRDSNGNQVPSNSSVVEVSYDYISYLKLSNVHKPQKYTCWAHNTQGSGSQTIEVTVSSPFVVNSHPREITNAKYGEEVVLRCNITSPVQMEINWFRTSDQSMKKEIITTSSVYTVSSDGTNLKIKSMDLDLVGTYSCQASLLSDGNITKLFSTDVRIYNLVAPVIEKKSRVIESTENTPAVISCKILKSVPKPEISWQFKSRESDKFVSLNSGDELHISRATLNNSGQYKCTAKNAVGRDEATTELVVVKAPEANIIEGTKINAPYYSTQLLTCKVTAHPPPSIIWKNEKGMPLQAQISHIGYEYSSQLKLTKVTTSAKYYCYVENKKGMSTKSTEVNVLSAFTVPNHPEGPQSVEYGKEGAIYCKVQSSLPIRIKWFRTLHERNEEIRNSNKYSISADGAVLKIKFMDLDLVGKYICKASLLADENQNQAYNTDVIIHGLAVPEIDKSTAKVTVRVKDSATIRCKVKGNPKPNISWQFKRNLSDKFHAIAESNEELNIASAELTHSGYYECTATNVAGHDQLVTELLVEAPPKIDLTNNTRIHEAVEGDVTLRIPCNVVGYPEPTITWQKEGIAIAPDNKYSIENGALVIKNPLTEDTYKYTCKAKNKLGSDTHTFEGIITPFLDTTENYGNIHKVYIKEGESKNINCRIPHTKSDSVRWYMEGLATNVTGSSFYLEDAKVSHDGNYTCRVSNSIRSKSETYVVDVGYPPTFIQKRYSPIIDWNGDPRSMVNCDVKGKPEVKGEWWFNGQPLRNADTLRFKISGWGDYTCQISNVHGAVKRTFTVTSTSCLINRTAEASATTPLWLNEMTSWSNQDLIILRSKQELKLSCPSQVNGVNSFQMFSDKNQIEVICDQKDRFSVDGKSYKFSDFRCKDRVMPVVIRTGTKCAHENTELIRVGFNVNDFIETYVSCYDTNKNVPLSTHVEMSYINLHNNAEYNKWFKYPGIGDGKIDKEYTCGKSSSSCCYAKGQLLNARDVGFGAAQTSTFIDHLNSIPIWRPCGDTYRMSWENLEESIRSELKINPVFDVWSGASKFNKKNGGNIPRYLWKVVKSNGETSAIVYVNDASPTDSDILCKDICGDSSVPWMNKSDRFTYCCTVEEFLKAFNLPENIVLNYVDDL